MISPDCVPFLLATVGRACDSAPDKELRPLADSALPQTLHLHGVADGLASWLPSGLAGGVGMIRNWLFTVFYCMSELWGDVVLSLLFWGLANETTALHDASLLYPLFGIGANIGQVRPDTSARRA